MGAAVPFVFIIPIIIAVVLLVMLQIWNIKTAIKQALRGYDQERSNGPQEH